MTNRPISPHLQVYKPQLTSVLSILHRISGVILSFGIPFLVFWLWAVASEPGQFELMRGFFASVIGRILLFGWTLAFFYHLCNGVRHLFWDAGKGFELETVYRSGWLVVVVASVLTLATWIAAYSSRGVV